MSDLNNRLNDLINSSEMMLFMKGTPDQPMCRFSANTIMILNQLGADFGAFNILADNEVREGLKSFSNWPTFPQLYYKGELVGGNDIVTEMFENGELQDMVSH